MATILVVDDNRPNREFLITLLGYRSHRMIEASDGLEALAFARSERPDLIISDILMPTMDGYELVRQLRSDPRHRNTPVIFYTAHYHEEEARGLAHAWGVADVLSKGCEPKVILQAVEAALQREPPVIGPPPANDDFD